MKNFFLLNYLLKNKTKTNLLIIGILIIMASCAENEPIPEKVTFQTTMMNIISPSYRVDTSNSKGIILINRTSTKQLILKTKEYGEKKLHLKPNSFEKKNKEFEVHAHDNQDNSYRILFNFNSPFSWWKVDNECAIYFSINEFTEKSSGEIINTKITSVKEK